MNPNLPPIKDERTPCPNCSHGFDWPKLRQSGRAEPEDLYCPVCGEVYDSRPGRMPEGEIK